MSRSYKAAYCTDNSHSHASKKMASRVHRHNERIRLLDHGDMQQEVGMYIAQPSRAYTNPYDICDWRFPAGADGWPVRGKNKIRK